MIGSFAMYYDEPRAPSDEELQLIEAAADVARIAIEQQRAHQTGAHLIGIGASERLRGQSRGAHAQEAEHEIEHVEAERADRHDRPDHHAIAEDVLARMCADQIGDDAESRQGDDIDFGMAEEPEQVLPKKG